MRESKTRPEKGGDLQWYPGHSGRAGTCAELWGQCGIASRILRPILQPVQTSYVRQRGNPEVLDVLKIYWVVYLTIPTYTLWLINDV